MNDERLASVIEHATGLENRIDYLEDQLFLLCEAIEQLENEIRKP